MSHWIVLVVLSLFGSPLINIKFTFFGREMKVSDFIQKSRTEFKKVDISCSLQRKSQEISGKYFAKISILPRVS